MISVAELFDDAGVTYSGVVRWGQAPNEGGPGVYVISTTERADQQGGLDVARLDREAIADLLRVRPEATVDGVAATLANLSTRFQEMWVRDEPVVYIGFCLLYTSPSPRDQRGSRMPSSA